MLLINCLLFLFTIIGFSSVGFREELNGRFNLFFSLHNLKSAGNYFARLIVYRFRGSENWLANSFRFLSENGKIFCGSSNLVSGNSHCGSGSSYCGSGNSHCGSGSSYCGCGSSYCGCGSSYCGCGNSNCGSGNSYCRTSNKNCRRISKSCNIVIISVLNIKSYSLTNKNHSVCILNGMRT